jgi:hypothetical protein
MRLAVITSIITAAAMWLALGGSPVLSQKQQTGAMKCESCGQCKKCPHCGKGGGWHHNVHEYEYKCVHQSERANKKAADAMSAQFSTLGAEGWRLSKADGGFWCFKRVKVDSE